MPASEVAKWMEVTPQTIRNWARDGIFGKRGVKQLGIHRRMYIAKDAVEKAIEKGYIIE